MNHVLSIARKEFRAYFRSPIALIFLSIFLFVTLFTFFRWETFFARNIADIRPLFSWMPILLIFLSAALTMRLWSEEQKLGTMELLLTLPVEVHKLVLGKFLAALALVSVALALTFPIPITVSFLGDLDWGPVIGGYVGALLLAGAYIAIGLFFSATTDNQIVSLLLTGLVGGLLYLVGQDAVTNFVGNHGVEVLQAIGTGSRFESIQRGVIDFRDLVYYASLTASFLALNMLLLRSKGWSQGKRTRPERRSWGLLGALVVANCLAINILLAPVTQLRADLTARHEYTISDVTKDLVSSLGEPLLIRGYFSAKTHPLLAPMVPRLRDLIEEYGVVSSGRVVTEFVDPRDNEEVEKEANQLYNIKSFPFRVQSAAENAVVNSYFSVLVKYGDQFQVLDFSDLIEVQPNGLNNIEVRLRNPEYDLTRAIKKVATGFRSTDLVFDSLSDEAELLAYVTPATLPENYKEVPERIKKVLEGLKEESKGKFKYEVIDPDAAGAKQDRQFLLRTYGFKPYAIALFSQDSFYLHLLLRVGDRYERVVPDEEFSEASIKESILASLRRAAPGFLKTVGIVKAPPEQPEMPPQFGRPPPPAQDVTRLLTRQLEETYTVKDVDLKDGRVPADVDVLLVYGPNKFDDKQKFAVDQYLMRGGTVVVLSGHYELDPASQTGIQLKKVSSGLEDLLASYGVTVEETLVMDTQNEKFPAPVERNLGGFRVREIQLLNYPYFVDVRANGMAEDSPVVAGLPAVTMQWASPIKVTAPTTPQGEEPLTRTVSDLVKSSPRAWTKDDTNVMPNFDTYPEDGFATGDNQDSYVLATAVQGAFDSYYKDKKAPTATEGNGATSVIQRSPDNARLAVVGTSSFVNDMVLGLSRQSGSDRFTNNLQFVQNLVDWGVEDVDLLKIRSRGAFARTLLPKDARGILPLSDAGYEALNYAIAIALLVLMAIVGHLRRARVAAMELEPAKGRGNQRPDVTLDKNKAEAGA
ncbi:MAG: Gldg family protein [Deltaproteobacteria bacterium]|nr:Gldg family protein [Deltaproteobacteria bacterium]